MLSTSSNLVALITAQARTFFIFLLTFLSHLSDYLLHIASHLHYLDVDTTEADVWDARIVSPCIFIRLRVRPARAR